MATPILATKIYVPPPPAKLVPRARLVERLREGFHRKLTLICAPAGFGKSTLISEWVAAHARPVAWLSLDEGDKDPSRFLAYLIAALQANAPGIGEGVLGELQSTQSPPTKSILTTVLNEIAAVVTDSVLVLDDYHAVDAKPVDDVVAFLLEHLPPQMHLIIATREDPHLPLARLRSRGELTELRAVELRFTPSEAAEFLTGAMGLDLSEEAIALLETRTEGWIAGLQLAALSMRGREDVSAFIQSFTGSHRFVLDYLVEEVLQSQPDRIRRFLLETSILDRLTGPLCDTVTGREGSREMLEALERGNFFVTPLDDDRRWYRYHNLFADVLSAHLMEERRDRVSMLHRRASEWYEQHGSQVDAIWHALAAGDVARAAGMVELALPVMRRSKQEATVLGWLEALPDEVLQSRPVLSAGYAWALLTGGELGGVEARLRDAERWLDPWPERRERPAVVPADMVVVDEEEFRRLPGSIALYRAALAHVQSDMTGDATHARRALDLVPDDDHLRRGAAAGLLGLAMWASGDLEEAHRTYADGMARVRMAGYVSDAISGTIVLADIRIAQGRLRDAMSTYEQALRFAEEQDEPALRGLADLYVGMSELHRERNDLEAAAQHLSTSSELGVRAGLPQRRHRWCIAMARIREAQGDLDGALGLLHEAERLNPRDFSPHVRPVAALKVRWWLSLGRLRDALDWAREQGLAVDDDLSYIREYVHITLSRVLLARYESDGDAGSMYAAMDLLGRLLRAAEAGGRMGSVIEILNLQARAHRVHGNVALAYAPLERALALAEPEGYVRIFLDEGTPMADMLRSMERLTAARQAKPYLRGLLAAFEGRDAAHSFGFARDGTSTTVGPFVGAEHAVEPLNGRELEVLRLIAQGLSNREIGERLFRALSTIKGQNRIIFDKLHVRNRTEAVARARELGLL